MCGLFGLSSSIVLAASYAAKIPERRENDAGVVEEDNPA
jgi:hypothetical protein